MSISSDDYFVQMMSSLWKIAEREDDLVFKERLDQIVGTVRLKLQNLTKTTDEFKLRKVFKEFDTAKNGYLTVDQLQALCVKLGITFEKKYLVALFKKFDSNNSGNIEFEEFCSFITYGIYTK